MTEEMGFDLRQKKIVFSKMSTQAQRLTYIHIQKKERHKLGPRSNYLPKYSTEVMNEWSYISVSSNTLY